MPFTTKTVSAAVEERDLSRNALRWSLYLLAVLCTGAAGVETGTRLLVPRISRIEGRTEREYRAALAPPVPGRQTVLIVGNSLLDAAVRMDRLQEGLGSSVDARRFLVEQTGYWDWYFGLRRLFADGARPAVVVLVLGRQQITVDSVRGDYFAYRLMLARDIFPVAFDLHLHPTVAASMLTGHFSGFYGLRSEIRKVLLGRLMPDLPELMAKITISPGPHVTTRELASVGVERLRAMNTEVAAGGARFVFVLVPGLRGDADPVGPFQAAAAGGGVPTITTLCNGQLLPSDFRDGFHMNEQGSATYTEALIRDLKAVLGSFSGAAPGIGDGRK